MSPLKDKEAYSFLLLSRCTVSSWKSTDDKSPPDPSEDKEPVGTQLLYSRKLCWIAGLTLQESVSCTTSTLVHWTKHLKSTDGTVNRTTRADQELSRHPQCLSYVQRPKHLNAMTSVSSSANHTLHHFPHTRNCDITSLLTLLSSTSPSLSSVSYDLNKPLKYSISKRGLNWTGKAIDDATPRWLDQNKLLFSVY